MKKALLVLLLCGVVVGFYRGWFTLSSHRGETGSSKVDISLTVDPDKAKEDAAKVKNKTSELGDRARDKLKSEDRVPPTTAPAAEPGVEK